ncbi:MAG: FecR domain-containing protein, partial [Myxococcota bacterium]
PAATRAEAPPPTAAPEAPAPAPASGPEVRVLEASGVLEKRQAQKDSWSPLGVGDTLGVDDSVRTGRNSSALLKVGDQAQVRVAARTELNVREISEEVSRVRLDEGRIVAEVTPGGNTVFRVETKGSDATVESKAGRFSMVNDGRGQVAVATETGQVRLQARGKSVDVPAGTQSVVEPGAAPQKPREVPRSLLLKVATPARSIQRELEHEVVGQTTPGSLVRVKGRVARVDPDGRFRIKVPLDEGRNAIEINAVDAAGHEKLTRLDLTVDRSAPAIKGHMEWGAGEAAPQTQ